MGIPVQLLGDSSGIGRQKNINLLSYIDRKRANEYSRKQTSHTNRFSKVKENEIYGVPKSLVIWVFPSKYGFVVESASADRKNIC